MAVLGEIRHTTTYKYANPVTFGTHRAMFLPRRGAAARLLNWSARTSLPSKIQWISDSRSNTITVMEFDQPASELTFTFKVLGIYFGLKGIETFRWKSGPKKFQCNIHLTSGLISPVICTLMQRIPRGV